MNPGGRNNLHCNSNTYVLQARLKSPKKLCVFYDVFADTSMLWWLESSGWDFRSKNWRIAEEVTWEQCLRIETRRAGLWDREAGSCVCKRQRQVREEDWEPPWRWGGKLTERGQEGYFRQVVWTRRENERDGRGEDQVRDHPGEGRNRKQMVRIWELQIRRSGE